MPKMKTKSGTKKRFRLTASGKVVMFGSGKRHNLSNMFKNVNAIVSCRVFPRFQNTIIIYLGSFLQARVGLKHPDWHLFREKQVARSRRHPTELAIYARVERSDPGKNEKNVRDADVLRFAVQFARHWKILSLCKEGYLPWHAIGKPKCRTGCWAASCSRVAPEGEHTRCSPSCAFSAAADAFSHSRRTEPVWVLINLM